MKGARKLSQRLLFLYGNTKNFTKINQSKFKYPNLKSTVRPVSHCDEIPVPNPSTELQSSLQFKSERIASDGEHYQKEISNDSAKLFLQAQLNDLPRELNLSKESTQIIRSRLKE